MLKMRFSFVVLTQGRSKDEWITSDRYYCEAYGETEDECNRRVDEYLERESQEHDLDEEWFDEPEEADEDDLYDLERAGGKMVLELN